APRRFAGDARRHAPQHATSPLVLTLVLVGPDLAPLLLLLLLLGRAPPAHLLPIELIEQRGEGAHGLGVRLLGQRQDLARARLEPGRNLGIAGFARPHEQQPSLFAIVTRTRHQSPRVYAFARKKNPRPGFVPERAAENYERLPSVAKKTLGRTEHSFG